LASGGYIIRMSPMAIGRLVVPTVKRPQKPATPLHRAPVATPMPMARKIQRVR